MPRFFRRLRAMPDRERARLLAIISASVIIGLLYGLGGVSLYLRARYLRPTPAATPRVVVTQPPYEDEVGMPTLYPTVTPPGPAAAPATETPEMGGAPTLFPTLTPKPGA